MKYNCLFFNRLEKKEFKADPKSCKHEFTTTNVQRKGSAIKIYNTEKLKVEQKELLEEISKFVSDEAQEKDLYETERGIFRLLQKLGLSFLKENLARRGTGKIDGSISVAGKQLSYHSTCDCVYLSIFGEIVIRRAYFWEPGEKGCCPLDTQLNLPQRRYSFYMVEKRSTGSP